MNCYICGKTAIAICAKCNGGVCGADGAIKWGKFYCTTDNPSKRKSKMKRAHGVRKNGET